MAKQTAAAPAKTTPPVPDPQVVEDRRRQKVVDLYAELHFKLLPFRPELRQYDALAKDIRSWYPDAEPTMPYIVEGQRFKVIAGPRAKERKVANVKTLLRKFTSLWEVAKVTISDIEKYVPANEQAVYITPPEATGSRPLSVAPLLRESAD